MKKKKYFNTRKLKNKKKIKKNRKLNYVKNELFLIKKIKKTINYKLNLLKNAKIYSRFHVIFLKLIDLNIFIQKTFYYTIQKNNEFVIKKILK